jgi:hypothetical protein
MIRDPRDIWVSGHLYHRHCQEEWCINTDMDPTPPIAWPKVDHSFAHWPEDWKRRYLERLNGKSYQRNLLERSMVEGLDFELEGYTGCTLAAMREWRLNGADALDVKLEDVMADFDGARRRSRWRVRRMSTGWMRRRSPPGRRYIHARFPNGETPCCRSRSPGSRRATPG